MLAQKVLLGVHGFDAEYALVVRFMMRTGAGLADAEDAMQHVAEQGWRKVTSGQWDQVHLPRAWARTVALNHHRAQCRKHNAAVRCGSRMFLQVRALRFC
ncbi:sigma factor [Actinocorallia aurantiaca]|uniref:RNA polymerase sigma-70 region 2 domain-containing protein n=1 Tax=Actinocorallia aurantiaca TaxID=46204 RepID=A0ABN3UL43_9ACTN